ncbi:MAG: hypothetical protein PHV54_01655 [Tolumonas sp.]|nr:hypothetical protein [Tolumonas sp.]
MTNKELLELAAKSVGVKLEYRQDCGAHYYNNPETGRERWNPLEDDGQALRVAVKLRLQVSPNDYDTMVNARLPLHITAVETHNNDQYAATRRAIVRVAADIGRSLNIAGGVA